MWKAERQAGEGGQLAGGECRKGAFGHLGRGHLADQMPRSNWGRWNGPSVGYGNHGGGGDQMGGGREGVGMGALL